MKTDEMPRLKSLFEKRLSIVKAKAEAVFQHRPVDFPPFLVNGAFYHLFGMEERCIPESYYDDPQVMTGLQEALCFEQLSSIEDDFVPYLLPWFGTGVLASALGAQVEFAPKADPAVNPRRFALQVPEDIRRLRMPDPERDGLMPKVLSFIRHMRRHSLLPVGITDCQGPLATATQLAGYDKLFFWMYDHPGLVHELMEKIAEALILWVRRQKVESGEPLEECFGDQLIYTGKHAGVWLSDDDAAMLSPALYREFVVPYNSKVLRAFGRGILHYCGNANHQIDNFLATEGLIGINNYILHDITGTIELKKRIEGRLVLLAVDFTPLDYQDYYTRLFEGLSSAGLIVHSQFSPTVALTAEGKYVLASRDKADRKRVFDFICRLRDRR